MLQDLYFPWLRAGRHHVSIAIAENVEGKVYEADDFLAVCIVMGDEEPEEEDTDQFNIADTVEAKQVVWNAEIIESDS